MGCEICGKTEVPLFKGLYDNRVVFACESCVNIEGILVISKPSAEQLEKAEKRETVRQTMERLSGHYLKRPIANIDHDISDRSLEKIKVMPKAQKADELIDNYNWEIKMARRRKKMSEKDLARATGISLENINRIEQGYLPKDFPIMIAKIENTLGIVLLRETNSMKIKFNFPKKNEENIDLERMKMERQKELNKRKEMQAKTTLDLSQHKIEEKRQPEIQIPKTRTQIAMERLHSTDKPRKYEEINELRKDMRQDKLDFADKNLKDVKLADLVDKKIKEDKEDMTGDDVEFED